MICTKERLRLCRWLTALVLCFIWGNSLMPGWVSEKLSLWLQSLLNTAVSVPEEPVPGDDMLLRKFAHFSEFALLGALLCWQLGMLGKEKKLALPLGFGAACLDELIQCFVPERGPGLKDVALDTCGVAAGIGLLLLTHKITKQIKHSKENKTP